MLIGIDAEGNIKFIFTDESYLNRKYPNNSAKVSNFWNTKHGLTEFFIDKKDFPDCRNYQNYRVMEGKLIKKEN
jgi:hypothetical protein